MTGRYNKKEFCAYVVSNGSRTIKERDEIFYKLSEYKKVNSGGRYLNNIGEPNGVADKLEFLRKHKFSIAFENTCHHGYTTEKLVQAFSAKTIPIYMGDELVSEIFNTQAFVNCHDFKNLDDAVEYVKKIDNDDKLYKKMLSEPALKNAKTLEDEQKNLEKFLLNIFDQKKEDAFRRDRFSFSKFYCEHLLDCEMLFDKNKNSLFNKTKNKTREFIKKVLKIFLTPNQIVQIKKYLNKYYE